MSTGWKYRVNKAIKKEALKEFENWSIDDFINHILELRGIIEESEKTQVQESKGSTLTEKDYSKTGRIQRRSPFYLLSTKSL